MGVARYSRNYSGCQVGVVSLTFTASSEVSGQQLFWLQLSYPPLIFWSLPPPGARVASANCFRGAFLSYWGGVTSIVLKYSPHLSHLKFALGPYQVSASPTHVYDNPFQKSLFSCTDHTRIFQIRVSLCSFDNIISSSSSAKVEFE